MRIGILGGSFNPVHSGHLNLAEDARRILDLEKVVFVPAYEPPHKSPDLLIDCEDRFRMLELAVRKNPAFEVSRYEIEKKTKSYTIETIEYLKEFYTADAELFFLIGADSLKELDTWKDVDRLSRLCHFVVCDRPGFSKDTKYPWVEAIEIRPVDISSTQIRKMVKAGEDIGEFVPQAVSDYISKNTLYR
ncbi:MAG: nicotinate-nucleotide adenylyltransferase [Candidatus Omnitrophica bacterium]|nr:nicotinate-nucleotide adenylyltransferase [Candidatus Omnitrophota bacterium]